MTKNPVTLRRTRELVELILAQPADSVTLESTTHELLNAVFDGIPLDELRPLLHSDIPAATKAGAWILSELGTRAGPLIDEIPFLLAHDLGYVRFFALDVVLANASTAEERLFAAAVGMITDSDEAVRWKALRTMSRLPIAALVRSHPIISSSAGPLVSLVAWLISQEDDDWKADEVTAKLLDSDPLARLVAVVAAIRGADRDCGPLERAEASSDLQVASFAKDELRAVRRRHGP